MMASTPVRRRWLLVELAVFALPTTVVVLALTGMMVFDSIARPLAALGASFAWDRAGGTIALVLIPLACLAGFWRIAVPAVRGRSLTAIGTAWWLMMMIGMVIAAILLAMMVLGTRVGTPREALQALALGPAMLVPATHLLIERGAA